MPWCWVVDVMLGTVIFIFYEQQWGCAGWFKPLRIIPTVRLSIEFHFRVCFTTVL